MGILARLTSPSEQWFLRLQLALSQPACNREAHGHEQEVHTIWGALLPARRNSGGSLGKEVLQGCHLALLQLRKGGLHPAPDVVLVCRQLGPEERPQLDTGLQYLLHGGCPWRRCRRSSST